MRKVAFAFSVACWHCQPSQAPAVSQPVERSAPRVERADDCRRDIPDCSAACALRETNHLEFIDWYDRRCAAVVLGKNPDKAAGTEPDAGNDAPATQPARSCDPPFSLDAQGVKIWKRECL
jgi:hypothetical protein